MRPRSGSADRRVPVYILAGGRSTRFGSDKARAATGGVSLVVRLAELLKPVAQSITVIAARSGAYDDLGLKTIGDVIPDKGPIGGLVTAFEDFAREGWVFVTACDWVGVRPQWIDRLWDKRHETVQAVVLRTDRREPLFTLYHSSIAEIAHAQIRDGALAMHELLDRAVVVEVTAPPEWSRVTNVNHPSELG